MGSRTNGNTILGQFILLTIILTVKSTTLAYTNLSPIKSIITSKTSSSTTFPYTKIFSILPNHSGRISNDRFGRLRTDLKMIGDFFAGVTGSPPSSLDPPTEILLQGTSIDPAKPEVDLQCVYKASEDGWSAVDFHRCCDGRGSGLVVALTKSGKKFGGFNPLGWSSTDDYGSSNSAFLWFLKSGIKSNEIIKCPVLTGGNAVIFDYATGGPQFGSADLVIGSPQAAVMGGFAGPDMEDTSINAGDLRSGKSSVGGAYESTKDWPVRGSFSLVELEIYCNNNVIPSGGNDGALFGFWPF